MKHTQATLALASLMLFSTAAMSQSPGTLANPPASGDNGSSFAGWMSQHQSTNQGRISRKAYMDEVGRRWDQADTSKQGLTADQINQTYGMGATGAAGVNTAPGNMGPNNVKK